LVDSFEYKRNVLKQTKNVTYMEFTRHNYQKCSCF